MAQEDRADQALPMHGLIDCPKCGHSNPEGERYCNVCGASLAGVAVRRADDKPRAKGVLGKLRGRKGKAA